ncbi:hypothetical protein PG993_011878 [Apiospora rasikravindrae]|uniref:ZZ-type domain-containing protein n=1 Tax=Apiospora rasikravindrae TaxID=990691 RepID=A0ABR1S269_9PEZI
MSSTPDWDDYELPAEPTQARNGETTDTSSLGSDANSVLFRNFTSAIEWPETDPTGPTADQEGVETNTQEAHLGSSDFRIVANADVCWHCKHTIDQDYYHCSTCGDLDICDICVGIGNYCKSEDHWLVKCQLGDDGPAIRSSTQIIRTGWALTRVKDTTEPPFILSPGAGSVEKKWRSSYKRTRDSQVPFDYCHLCRATFPVDEPPQDT